MLSFLKFWNKDKLSEDIIVKETKDKILCAWHAHEMMIKAKESKKQKDIDKLKEDNEIAKALFLHDSNYLRVEEEIDALLKRAATKGKSELDYKASFDHKLVEVEYVVLYYKAKGFKVKTTFTHSFSRESESVKNEVNAWILFSW